MKKPLVLALGLTATACVSPPDDLEVGVDVAAITGGSNASAFQLARAIRVPACTATRISPRHAVTSSTCSFNFGDTVYFYDDGPSYEGTLTGRIDSILNHSGITVLGLSSESADDDALSGVVAKLSWRAPSEDANGTKVGAGNTGTLRQITDGLATVEGSMIYTDDDDVGPGDGGGPLYVNSKVVGVLQSSDGSSAAYKSTVYHIEWILDAIGYKWGGATPYVNGYINGETIEYFVNGNEHRCQYACEMTQACEGYSYIRSVEHCTLLENVTSVGFDADDPGINTAIKGGRSSTSGPVAGYVRSDGIDSIVHRRGTGVNELWRGSTNWQFGTISSTAPAPESELSAYKRADGINAVVYRSATNRIIELALVNGQWTWGDLTNAAGAATPVGSPIAYVRNDGVSAVVYRATTGQIHELRLGSRGSWIATNLSAAAGTSITSTSDPSAYNRSDGYASVVYRSGSLIFELYKAPGGTWTSGGLTNLANAPAATGRPHGYVRNLNRNAVVYRSTSDQLVELYLASDGWQYRTLASNVDGDPMGYMNARGLWGVVYRRGTQLFLANSYGTHNMSYDQGTYSYLPAMVGDPTVFTRIDHTDSMLIHAQNGDVLEVYQVNRPNTSFGSWANISESIGE